MKILLTGGCGYVGTPLAQRLIELGHELTVEDVHWFGNYLKPAKGLKVMSWGFLVNSMRNVSPRSPGGGADTLCPFVPRADAITCHTPLRRCAV